MNRSLSMTLVAAGAVACGMAMVPDANAQPGMDRAVEQYLCKDVMRESGNNRDVAIAFLHGFLLGKANTSNFNLEVLERQTDSFIERCLSNPNEKAVDAMVAAKK
jgi:HdeA/HdeB family protein